MPYISNKELDTLIKMEHVIGSHESELFTEPGEKRFFTDPNGKQQLDYQVMVDKKSGATTEDFYDYWLLIEKIIKDRQEASRKANAWNKANPEKHRKTNRNWAVKNRKSVLTK